MAEYIRPEELAKRLAVHRRTLGRWVEAGRMPAPLVVAGTHRYRAAAIERWLQAGGPAVGKPMLAARSSEGK